MAEAQKKVVKSKKVDAKAVDKEAKNTEVVIPEIKDTKPEVVAKAGKRSAKAIAEKEELLAKEVRKSTKANPETEAALMPKSTKKPTRSKIERQSKKMRASALLIDKNKSYSLKEALGLAIKTSTTKFDATAELHINLGVDPRQADQNIRDNIVLPAGTGKVVRVAAFAEADVAATAIKAGADIAGEEEITNKLDKGIVEFDVLITSPSQMSKLSKYARTLGPKGLMPNPKSGTVTNDIPKAIKEAKAGRVEYRVDSTGIVHLGIGKLSFGEEKLLQNAEAVLASIKSNKPSSLKSSYIKTAYIATTMGPSIKLDVSLV